MAKQSRNLTNSMTILGDGDCAMRENNNRSVDVNKKHSLQREASNGSLEYLPIEGHDGASALCADWEARPSSGGWRPRSSGGYRPDSGGTRRTPTPTKYVKLEAPRVKNSSHDDTYGNDFDWRRSVEEENRRTERYKAEKAQQKQDSTSLQNGFHTPGAEPSLAWRSEDEASSKAETSKHSTARTKHSCEASTSSSETKPKATAKKTEEPCDLVDVEEKEEEEKEEKKAPNELLMEFVESVIGEDYENAQKLCKMILMYEPNNPEALKFGPLIEERLRLDEESDTSDEEDSDDESDEDEDEEESEEEENKDDAGSEDMEEESGETAESTEAEDEEDEDGKWMELAQHLVEQMKLQQQQLEEDI